MQISPSFKIETVAQLQPGTLFLAELGRLWFVGMVCAYSNDPADKRFLTLGPQFPDGHAGPALMAVSLTAVSFASEAVLRLPVEPRHWTEREPSSGPYRLLVIGSDIYFGVQGFTPEFVNAVTGEILRSKPSGTTGYAISWEIVTTEQPTPRVILRYPFAEGSSDGEGKPDLPLVSAGL